MATNGNGSPSSDPLRSLTKHHTYYISAADLSFLVENVYFRVHRYFFERESRYFAGELAGEPPQGTQDSNAIVLKDITVEHFATFLWVFYNPRYSLYDASVADWETILGLAVRWEFPEVKNLAVRELEKKTEISVSKRIKLYQENQVDKNILIPHYAALSEREAHVTLEEGQDIGMETMVMIATCRGEVRALCLAPLSPTVSGTKLHDVVREVFGIVPAVSSENKNNNTGNLSGTPITPNPNKKVNGTNGTNTDTPDKSDSKKRVKKGNATGP